ncbi:MAG TPA: (2Fe-2S)-binding protein [Vicinamibacterales bacterium]|nr:(2Fe-2S)-binding protein [Vicinamibacterales bacterium]
MAEFVLLVNGREHRVSGEATDSLLTVLRDDLGLTGSKFGCGEGYCGACTVLIDGQATRACVARLGAVGKQPITTIESLGTPGALHPVQQAFVDAEAFQCGYCTPGMIMAVVALLKTTPDPTDADIARLLDRNVCRCGTFPRIVKAVHAAARAQKAGTHFSGSEGK